MRFTAEQLAQLQRTNPDLVVIDGLNYSKKSSGCPTPKLSEHDLQKAVFDWCDNNSLLMPEVSLLMAIPNGQYRKGQRPEPGMMPGAFDIFLPVPSGQFHGLWIELKVGANKPSRSQLDFMRRMQHQGYKCVVIWDSVDAVIKAISNYLEEE